MFSEHVGSKDKSSPSTIKTQKYDLAVHLKQLEDIITTRDISSWKISRRGRYFSKEWQQNAQGKHE